MLKLMYITNNPCVALIAEKNGVERVWIDLETLGKEERQKNINSVKSHHSIEDINLISNVLTKSQVMVRINPINKNSVNEIERVISAGANIIMLPMWHTANEVETFLQIVNKRAKTNLLLETKQSVECLDEILTLKGIDEIHIGLNDLHLSYGLTFMFELLSNGCVESLCEKIGKSGIPYGFGGIAKLSKGLLPAEKIIIEHYKLKSSMVILSRSFCDVKQLKDMKEFEMVFTENIKALRAFEQYAFSMCTDEYEANHKSIKLAVDKIIGKIGKENVQ